MNLNIIRTRMRTAIVVKSVMRERRISVLKLVSSVDGITIRDINNILNGDECDPEVVAAVLSALSK